MNIFFSQLNQESNLYMAYLGKSAILMMSSNSMMLLPILFIQIKEIAMDCHPAKCYDHTINISIFTAETLWVKPIVSKHPKEGKRIQNHYSNLDD